MYASFLSKIIQILQNHYLCTLYLVKEVIWSFLCKLQKEEEVREGGEREHQEMFVRVHL